METGMGHEVAIEHAERIARYISRSVGYAWGGDSLKLSSVSNEIETVKASSASIS